MSLKEDLTNEVTATFRAKYQEEEAVATPAPETLRLNSNHAKTLKEATVLYADLDGSTNMVDGFGWQFSADMYKAYLRCASQIIKSEGGTITAYDGDRVMAVFVGNEKNTTAVRTALKINHAVELIINPAIKTVYPSVTFVLKHVVGIDTSELRAARVGVRGDNDIVWIGKAANHAAKLCNLSERPVWITKAVYDSMMDSVKYTVVALATARVDMWEQRLWTNMNNAVIYRSNYHWTVL